MSRRPPSKPRGTGRPVTSENVSGRSTYRLQKFLATAGVDSRRNCEAYIRDGRVSVNGEPVTDPGSTVQPAQDDIRLDGERLKLPKLRYFLLNKPRGVLCTNRDPSGRPRAIDLVPSRDDRLFTVGRLDENTQGLLLLTNDGDLAERLAHPRYEVVRKYRAQVVGVPTKETLSTLRLGMHFSDGFFRFRNIRFLKRRGRSAILEIELREGKNREVRRMMARSGHKVINLERIAFGPLKIGHLDVGRSRELRPHEVNELRRFAYQEVSHDSKPAAEQQRRGQRRKSRPSGQQPRRAK